MNLVNLNQQYYYSSSYYRDVLYNDGMDLLRIPNIRANCYINVVLEFFYSIKVVNCYKLILYL